MCLARLSFCAKIYFLLTQLYEASHLWAYYKIGTSYFWHFLLLFTWDWLHVFFLLYLAHFNRHKISLVNFHLFRPITSFLATQIVLDGILWQDKNCSNWSKKSRIFEFIYGFAIGCCQEFRRELLHITLVFGDFELLRVIFLIDMKVFVFLPISQGQFLFTTCF